MPTVRFQWDAAIIDVRRQVCPQARWDKRTRAWLMTAADADAFLAAVHARQNFARRSSQIAVDDERWMVGFIHGGTPQKV